MSARRWQIQVDRVVVRGAPTRGLESAELLALVNAAVNDALRDAPLPSGRTMRQGAVVAAGAELAGGPAGVSRAIASGIAAAVGGGRSHG